VLQFFWLCLCDSCCERRPLSTLTRLYTRQPQPQDATKVNADLACRYLGARRKRLHHLRRHLRLALADVVLAEQELAVEVAGLDRVEVDLLVWRLDKGGGEQVKAKTAASKARAHSTAAAAAVLLCPPRIAAKPSNQLTTSMSSNPDSTSVFRSSQPMPPAPTARTFARLICARSQSVSIAWGAMQHI